MLWYKRVPRTWQRRFTYRRRHVHQRRTKIRDGIIAIIQVNAEAGANINLFPRPDDQLLSFLSILPCCHLMPTTARKRILLDRRPEACRLDNL